MGRRGSIIEPVRERTFILFMEGHVDWVTKNRVWLISAAAAVLLLIVVAGVYAQTAKSAVKPGVNLAGAGYAVAPGGAPGSLSGQPQDAGGQQTAPTPPVTGSGGSSAGNSTGNSTGNTTQKKQNNGTKKTDSTEKTFSAKVIFWNSTEKTKPLGAYVSILSLQPYRPNITKAPDTGVISGIPMNHAVTLVVHPDGALGKAIPVKIEFTTKMIPNSTQDALIVEVKDTSVLVTSNALGSTYGDFQQTFPRK